MQYQCKKVTDRACNIHVQIMVFEMTPPCYFLKFEMSYFSQWHLQLH